MCLRDVIQGLEDKMAKIIKHSVTNFVDVLRKTVFGSAKFGKTCFHILVG